MARRHRKRRQRRQSNDRRRYHIPPSSLYLKTLTRQRTVRIQPRTNRRKTLGLLQRTQKTHRTRRQTSRPLNRLVSRLGVVTSSRPNTKTSLQAQPSIISRKEHKCIRKPDSQKAGSGSGKYKGQWKPWCI